jgi:hypothetical protein
MNLQEAQQLAASSNQPSSKSFVEWAKIRREFDGDYSLVIELIEGEQQIFSDAQEAHLALVHLLVASSNATDRFFTLSEGMAYRRNVIEKLG